MEITEVRIRLNAESAERVRAYASITLDDCFVVRDLKIIDGPKGLFVAMPSRKLTANCSQCGMKNHLRSAYCNQCGSRQNEDRLTRDEQGWIELYADIAHPINSACREMIQERAIREYQNELQRAKLPGYVPRYDDIDGEPLPQVPHNAVAGHVSARHVAASQPQISRVSTPSVPTPSVPTPDVSASQHPRAGVSSWAI
jgi:stage V sporulation protein G